MAKIEQMGVSIPDSIKADPDLAEVWANIVPENNRFRQSDIPTLKLLVQWHGIAQSAKDLMEMTRNGDGILGIIAQSSKTGKVQKSPAVDVLKEASAEIRLLSDMLGISPTKTAPQPEIRTSKNAAVLQMALSDRVKREKKAAGA